GKRSAAGQDTSGAIPAFVPDGATLIRPTGSSRKPIYPGPASAAPPGDDHRHGAAFMPGGGSRLARHTVRATCR
ncbi:hypothetical protein, partial [Klebsiella pneumoniae]|uniref:hypothetical protein n=1 Tax=Klebsiella pneumoniae TaxID=573 RepID=UPI0034D1BFCE